MEKQISSIRKPIDRLERKVRILSGFLIVFSCMYAGIMLGVLLRGTGEKPSGISVALTVFLGIGSLIFYVWVLASASKKDELETIEKEVILELKDKEGL